ncbi:MAG: TrkH family potassium uptake protein [Paenibacillus macerans]|uniref:TrkH family potassium uptake protein n=1 Tax=Paenibacillus sp. FSL M7-0831 TaxID=2975314 RepID=UPI00056846C7|nr:TrkH family potassium uptake protein [Paenibacillus macerans]MCY7557056.1 TrkH family potassium uptake protein [Paenibacillus macerans]MDU7472964.1 TrkH family potassium uptake protein [Paenibacillus macerans]MEC0141405.1 TrkH family potassium uptake protein [Paenibacillus macerans]MEC0151653.1 TrkH family potassium uptake protein [Paenibacillus macerans]UMV47685.1 TrkH family potassium uptake protein [Paenibacillus macerans]
MSFKKISFSPPQILVLGFALIILLGSLLLMLPISSAAGETLPFVDALFTATSATCVTGLVVVDTGTYFSTFGQIVIMLLIQVGGLGFMTMATLFSLVLKRKISLKDRLILQEAMNQNTMEGIVRLIRKVLLYSLVIESCAALLFAIRWAFDMPLGRALYFGVFHAVSMFNNAGFDLFGEYRSLTLYVADPLVNFVAMFLIVSGGIGFIVLSDIIDFRRRRKLSLHSKVVLSMTSALIVVGALVIFIFEFTNPRTLAPLGWGGKFWAALFQSVTPRTAGANTVDIGELRQASQFFMIILMFIGASPSSTGGGIKTTTFTILVGAVISMIRGQSDLVLFRYRMAQERIFKAVTITMLALFLVVAVAMVLSTTEDASFLSILFETTSAFGTVGLTMGLTGKLTVIGKILISFTMFAGRLGPLTLAYALGPKKGKELYRHPEGKMIIG